jgi:hypothetical protein
MEKVNRNRKTDQAFLKQITEKTPENVTFDNSKPDCAYEIEHVYGFSGDRNKAVCYFGKDNNEIIFPAAALGIVQDLKTRQ